MPDLPDNRPTDCPTRSEPQSVRSRSAVSRSEAKLAELRRELVQAKRQLHEASVRERSIRESTLGRAVWRLIEQKRLEPSTVALIRDEVRPFLSSRSAPAFIGTPFELQSPAELERLEAAVPPVAQDIPAVTRLPAAPFSLPRRPKPT
ncbi:hypothetical protein [Bradyrhizobium sp. AS23.2]|uniref:hypothetical protein n=1 Tax=Bradyrhizobium sp. AS23.2 TaxID=1680155 RepID=UPI00116105B5|nr:hypothetical protein [Bradyrhizobium sp. AS23.2]